MKDIDNYDYLRGLCDGYAIVGPLDKDHLPEGINSFDKLIDRVQELEAKQKTIPRGVVKSFSRRFETLKVIKNPVTGDMGVDESGYLCHYSVDKWIKSEWKLQI